MSITSPLLSSFTCPGNNLAVSAKAFRERLARSFTFQTARSLELFLAMHNVVPFLSFHHYDSLADPFGTLMFHTSS